MKDSRSQQTAAHAAMLIAGGTPPNWLQPGLERVISRLLTPYIVAEAESLTRAETARQIKKVIKANSVLMANLGGQSAIGLEIGGGDVISLAAYLARVRQSEAARQLKQCLGA